MDRHSFTVEVAGGAANYDQYEDIIYKAGCDDALIGMVDGKIFIDFDRYASSYQIAVNSAVHTLEGLGATVIKVTPIVD